MNWNHSMEIRFLVKDHAYVVEPSGELIIKSLNVFQQAMGEKVKETAQSSDLRALVVDLSKVSIIDSSGIGYLTGSHLALQRAGKSLLLCHMNDTIQEMFELIRMDDIMPLFITIEDALLFAKYPNQVTPIKFEHLDTIEIKRLSAAGRK